LGRRVLYWFLLACLTLLLAARQKPHTAAPTCRSPKAARRTRTPLLTRRTMDASPESKMEMETTPDSEEVAMEMEMETSRERAAMQIA